MKKKKKKSQNNKDKKQNIMQSYLKKLQNKIP